MMEVPVVRRRCPVLSHPHQELIDQLRNGCAAGDGHVSGHQPMIFSEGFVLVRAKPHLLALIVLEVPTFMTLFVERFAHGGVSHVKGTTRLANCVCPHSRKKMGTEMGTNGPFGGGQNCSKSLHCNY